ncbi:MAG: energy transducer TonB, partial [Bryobacterales bacterium]|nr:energy transducer TonB [Bryobacterales bacterium]
ARGKQFSLEIWLTPNTEAPRFPKDVKYTDGEASVEVEFRVEADGSVHDINVVKGLGVEFDERMVEAVKQARFEPAKKAGKPVSVLVRRKIRHRE